MDSRFRGNDNIGEDIMDNTQTTITISHISWGNIEVTIDGQVFRFKDCKGAYIDVEGGPIEKLLFVAVTMPG